MAGLKIVTVTVTKENGETLPTPKTRYFNSNRIDDMVNIATGASFRYTPLYAAVPRDIETSTAASTIEAAANA